MNEPRGTDYLAHIRQAARDALTHVEGLDQEDFRADRRTQQAVIMCLLVIGEAAARLKDRHPEVAMQHPEIPWRNMRGMRNRIAHGYFDINLDVVWETVWVALPDLLARLEPPDPA
jgi:uncharacterized protein with HEPN domain